MTGLFGNRNFLLLLAASAISQAGSQVAFVATIFWLRETSDSASLLGFLGAITALPLLLLTPLGGVFADRWQRRKILILCDALCALLCIPLALFAATDQLSVPFAVTGMLAMNLSLAVCIAFSNPAMQSFVPDIVEPRQLEHALGFTQSLSLLCAIGGQALAAALLSHFSPAGLFALDGATYLASAAILLLVRARTSQIRTSQEQASHQSSGRIYADLRAAGKYIWCRPGMRLVLIAVLPVSICSEAVIVFLPIYTTDALRESLAYYPYLLAIFSTGMFLGYALTAKRSLPGPRRTTAATLSLILGAAICVSLALVHVYWIAALLLLFFGCVSGAISLLCNNAFISQTDPAMRGRVLSVMIMITQGITPLAMGMLGVVVDLLNRNVPLFYAACGATLLLVAVTFSANRDVRYFFGKTPAALGDAGS